MSRGEGGDSAVWEHARGERGWKWRSQNLSMPGSLVVRCCLSSLKSPVTGLAHVQPAGCCSMPAAAAIRGWLLKHGYLSVSFQFYVRCTAGVPALCSALTTRTLPPRATKGLACTCIKTYEATRRLQRCPCRLTRRPCCRRSASSQIPNESVFKSIFFRPTLATYLN